jgi:hypothetical protein
MDEKPERPFQFGLRSLFHLTAAVAVVIVALPWSWIWDSALPLVVVVAVPSLVMVGVFVGEVIKAWQSGPDP